jgi:hypothetical protein
VDADLDTLATALYVRHDRDRRVEHLGEVGHHVGHRPAPVETTPPRRGGPSSRWRRLRFSSAQNSPDRTDSTVSSTNPASLHDRAGIRHPHRGNARGVRAGEFTTPSINGVKDSLTVPVVKISLTRGFDALRTRR